MVKRILIGLGIIIGIALSIGAFGIYYFMPDANRVLDYIKRNPENASMLLIRNDSIIASKNIDKVLPLASTVKIILAIEYSEQSANNILNPDELVLLSDLERFHIPNTDGGAHSKWLKSVKDKIIENKISIREIAKGMIKFSSNANTEWLLNKLDIQKVNARIDSLELENHTEIYNIVSALFVGKELYPDLKGRELEAKLRELSMDDYIKATNHIHEKLMIDSLYKYGVFDVDMKIQKVWSDRLPASTVKDYVSIMRKMNDKNYFSSGAQQYLDEVMEFIMEDSANKKWLVHSGMKGGGTAFVLTKALYATDKNGNKTELAYFLNNLNILEMTRLQMSLNELELKILTSNEFRNKMSTEL